MTRGTVARNATDRVRLASEEDIGKVRYDDDRVARRVCDTAAIAREAIALLRETQTVSQRDVDGFVRHNQAIRALLARIEP